MALEKLGLEIAVEGLRKFKSDMEKADSSVGKSAGLWGRLGGAARGAGKILGTVAKVGIAAVATGATAAAAAVGGLVLGIGKLAMEAAPIEGVKRAFEGLTEEFTGGSEAMLKALQEASGGMITNRDLMMSFNQAVQLVGQNFGEQLPEAMQYLSKVAAATGEDMGYMMDSLVRGVGRLSPMILDNLGIQVDLTKATEEYADALGIEASELTKTQQQTALMNQVLEKLAENTADMPEVTGTAAATMAELKASIQNTKDEIGMAFLPALQALLVPLADIARDLGPQLIEWAQEAGVWLGENLPVMIEQFRAFMAQAWTYIQENVIPIMQQVWMWLQQNLPVAIAAVRDAWEDLQPALKAVWKFIKDKVIPVVQDIFKWLQDKIPEAIENDRKQWEEVLLPAIRLVWAFIQDKVIPILKVVAEVITTVVATAIKVLAELWKNVLYPALTLVWGFISEYIIPLFEALAEVAVAVLGKAVEILAALWENVLYPALQKVWKFIKEKVLPIFKAWAEYIRDKAGPVLEWLGEKILPVIQAGLEAIGTVIRALIEFFQRLKKAIESIQVPDWMRGKSPPPMAEWLSEIGSAVKALAEVELPKLAAEFSAVSGAAAPVMGAVGGGSSGDSYTYNTYNLSTTSSVSSGSLAMEFADMAMATR